MRIPGRTILTACTVALAAGFLAGCTPSHPITEPAKTLKPTPTPVFTSDADALAAATKIYKKFEAAVDAIGHDGGEGAERVKPYVSDAGYRFEVAEAEKFKKERAHGTGDTVLNNSVLQSRVERNGVATVTIYVCEDISAVDRIGPDGKSLISADRGDYNDYEVVLKGDSANSLVIQSNKYWSGGGICKL
ncbi:hypothetical protein GCM10022288_08590 [Gryllotalpicola kribbensis]|jgi:hypothetical protein|uniref:Lipoprotein n=1 Tax=Gryllotalpicola kribbensis TaxID=993084 RepID=A0ABP8ALF1_9MICO